MVLLAEGTMGNMVRIGALWRSKDKDSKVVASGQTGDKYSSFLVIRNDKKGNEKAPDFLLMVAERDREGPDRGSGEAERKEAKKEEKDIPF